MKKYIDADKLKAEMERQQRRLMVLSNTEQVDMRRDCALQNGVYDNILGIIDSLQQEQPSLPSNLDEAAEEYAYNNWEDNDYHTGASEGLPFDAIGHTEKCFKAGAEWMAGQGVVKEAVIGMATEEISINVSQQILDELELCPGDKVVVQIRKK